MWARLSTVRGPNADPCVADLLIVHLRIVDHDIQSQSLHRQPADRGQQSVRSDYAISCAVTRATRALTSSCCALRTSSVVRCPRLLADAIERNFGGVHLRCGCLDLRLGGVQLPPALHHRGPRLIAVDVKIEPLLTKRFLGLANGRIFRAALINRDGELAQDGDLGRPKLIRDTRLRFRQSVAQKHTPPGCRPGSSKSFEGTCAGAMLWGRIEESHGVSRGMNAMR